MANNDMNIAMKFTADVNRAKDNISQLNAELKESANVAQDANKKSAKSMRDVYMAQTEAMNRSAQATAAAEQQAKAQSIAAKAAEAHKKEVEKLRQGLDKLLASIDPATKGLSRLDELESKLRKSKKAGVIDSDTFDDYLSKISNQRAALSTVESLNDGTKRLELNTKSAHRTFFMMSKQLATGNFNGIGNSLFSIANMTGKLPPLFSAATLSVGAFIGVIYGVTKVISQLNDEQNRFNKALIATGNYAGTTSSRLNEISNKIGKINGDYKDVNKIIVDLTNTGSLSVRSIENIATASAHLMALTGQSAEDSIKIFDGMKNSVADWAMETSRQYNWLDLATYQHIAALEAQGNTEEAIAIATTKFSEVMEQRVNDMQDHLTGLGAAWKRFTKEVSNFGQNLKTDLKINMGMATLDEKIAKLQENKKYNSKITPDGFAVPWTSLDEEELQYLLAQKKAIEEKAEIENKENKVKKEATKAQKELDELHKQNATDAEKQAKAVDELRKKYEALWANEKGRKDLQAQGVTSSDGKSFAGGQYDKDVKNITDKGILEYNKGVEKSLKLTTELQRVMHEINEGQYKNASQAEKDRAIALAKQVDAKNAAKHNKKTDFSLTNDKTNLALQQQLNELLLGTKASDDTVEQWYNNLLAQFKKMGNKEGIDLIDQILPLKKAEANLNEIITKIQQAQSRQSTKEQSIQAQVTSGLITQVEAQSQLIDLHKQTAQELAKYLPTLQAMTELPGQAGENAQKALATLQLQIAELNKTTDALTNAFKNGLQSGIQGSLDSLAKGTFELKDALKNLAQSILSSMAQVATKGLADMAMNGLSNLGSSLFGAATDAAASAGLMETAIATSSATGAGLMGDSISMSAGIGAETISASMITAGTTAGEIISAAMISASSASAGANAGSSAIGAAAVAAATGGYITGAGTSTSDSIPAKLSNGEYVVKAASVKKYGVDYLHAINTGRLHRYATGGLVSNVSRPTAPNLYDENSSSKATNQAQSAPVIQQTLVLDSGEMMKSGISSVAGSRAMMTWIRANSQTLKQELS
jgi:phage-related minor tail protein